MLASVAAALLLSTAALAAPRALRDDVQVRSLVDLASPGRPLRLARDPTDGRLYHLRSDGSIHRVSLAGGAATTARVYRAADTGVPAPSGLAIGPEGNLYLTGNESQGPQNVGLVRRGARASPGADARVWSTVARTVPYPRSNTAFDHTVNGIAVSPDGAFLYVNSGSRTDHGEEQSQGGLFPGVREVPLTAVMLRLPAGGEGILLQNDEAALRDGGYLFARGLRNSFDPAFAPDGELFAGENSGDRDDPEELNWIRPGHHYGFPWRLGGNDTPQQFPGYDPENDLLVDHDYVAYRNGYFHDDSTYPPPPGVEFTEPVVNVGPDADSFRDPETGALRDASDLGLTLSTFTAHRSPLGLVFDAAGALSEEFRGDGFILAWTRGDPTGAGVDGPFLDPGQDLLHLDLAAEGGSYRVRTTRLVGGFDRPIDAAIDGNRLYVLEYGGAGAIWEVTLPAKPPPAPFRRGFVNADSTLDISDPLSVLFHLFAGGSLGCADAADADDDGGLGVADALLLLRYLFLDGPPPAEPFAACGPDAAPGAPGGELGCGEFPGCR